MVKRIPINFTYISLFLLIIWDALKHYVSLHSVPVQVAYILPLLVIGFIDYRNNYLLKAITSKPLSILGIWIIYSLINTFLINDYNILLKNPIVLGSSIIVAFFLTAFIVSNNSNTKSLINLLIFAFFVRLCFSLLFDGIAPVGDVNRFGAEFNANSVAFGALFLVALIFAKRLYNNGLSAIDILLLLLSITIIILTASRKNLIALLILAIGYIFITGSQNSLYNVLRYSVFTVILTFSTIWILNNTTVGERLRSSFDRTIIATNTGEEEKMFDGRASYFITGWMLFKDNPINGIGLTNFMYYDRFDRALHTEYMVQLTEGGIIGFSLFLYFYLYILYKINYIRIKHPTFSKESKMYLVFMAVMLFLFLGTWIYRNPMMWVLIALAIRFIYVVRYKTRNNNYRQRKNYRENPVMIQ